MFEDLGPPRGMSTHDSSHCFVCPLYFPPQREAQIGTNPLPAGLVGRRLHTMRLAQSIRCIMSGTRMPVLVVVCHAERSPALAMKREVSYRDKTAATSRVLKLPARYVRVSGADEQELGRLPVRNQ